MKLRPSKTEQKNIDRLKDFTHQATNTKAIMIAVTGYPEKCGQLDKLQEDHRELWARFNELSTAWRDLRSNTFHMDQLTGKQHPHQNPKPKAKKKK